MLNGEMMLDAEQRRLAWRCRRGMLELDIILQQFVMEQFNSLTLEELHVFDEMLTLPDTQFWSLIRSSKQDEDRKMESVLNKLRSIHLPHHQGAL
ncbi:MAG TPA: succinate dehydrogenase assembly factor 2 [Methylophilaceae bacterium]|nr:succinate dehydrogenase assembly factor 2 [Methylophilaceae bacterium]